jgi:hypothetical protein
MIIGIKICADGPPDCKNNPEIYHRPIKDHP